MPNGLRYAPSGYHVAWVGRDKATLPERTRSHESSSKRGARAGELQATAAHTGRIGARYTHLSIARLPYGRPRLQSVPSDTCTARTPVLAPKGRCQGVQVSAASGRVPIPSGAVLGGIISRLIFWLGRCAHGIEERLDSPA
jgi:hypothetical protein